MLNFRLSNGGEYLFQAKDDDELNQWVASINDSSGASGSSGAAGTSKTLPTGESQAPKEKKPFFTLKGSKK